MKPVNANVTYAVQAAIATVTLERTQAHNAFDQATGEAFVAIMRRAAADAAVRVVIVQARGPTFSAGGDFNWVLGWPALKMPDIKMAARLMTEVVQCVYDLPKPSIAKVQGACVGGGIGVMLACDYAVASEKARFGLTSVRNGLLAGIAIPAMIQALGARKTRQLLMHGGVMPADEALRIGLIDRLSSEDRIDADVAKLASELKLGAPSVQALIKKLVTQMDAAPNDAQMVELIATNVAEQCVTPDAKEGMSAFLQKRKAGWAQ